MKYILNAFILTMVLFFSLYLGTILPLFLYLGLQLSKKMKNQNFNVFGTSMSRADNFSTPITPF